jgi:hypothetical protein
VNSKALARQNQLCREDAGDGSGTPHGSIDCPLGEVRPQRHSLDQDRLHIGDADEVKDGAQIAFVVLE